MEMLKAGRLWLAGKATTAMLRPWSSIFTVSGEFAATVGIDFRAPFDRQSSFDRVVKHLGVCNFNIKLGVTDHHRLMSRWLEEAKTRPITTKDHECGAQTWPHNIYCEPEVVAVKGNGTV